MLQNRTYLELTEKGNQTIPLASEAAADVENNREKSHHIKSERTTRSWNIRRKCSHNSRPRPSCTAPQNHDTHR